MPAKSPKQQRWAGAMLAKKRRGEKVNIPEKVLRDYAKKRRR